LKDYLTTRYYIIVKEKNEMGEACSMNERKERCIQDFGGGNLGERDHLEDQGVDGIIILRWYFRKWDWAWIGLI